VPLTEKGETIKSAMQEKYGTEKGESVFYASKNKGTITGVDAEDCDMPTKSRDQPSPPPIPSGAGGLGGGAGGAGVAAPVSGALGGAMDYGLTVDELEVPERQDELVGDIPTSKAEEPKDKSDLPDEVASAPTMNRELVPVRPLSIPVGDQSLSNMNARNRSFWKR
jgi:hypothetical protein